MNKKFIPFLLAAIISVCAFFLILGGISLFDNAGKTSSQITTEETIEELNRFVEKKVDLSIKSEENRVKGTVSFEETALEDEIPDIEKYPFKVEGHGDINLEIFSSPEKAGNETSVGNDIITNTWLIKVAEDFNKKNYTIDGKTVSVSIRSITSGLMCDYISSGKYVPDGFTPSNEDWAEMLISKGVTINKEANSLVNNVAGIVLAQDTYNTIISNYGAVNINTITEATVKNEIAMGYTNPYTSSTGLNFLISSLYCFDSSDPLSNTAIEGFQKFQANVPVVCYNTTQMQGAIDSGVLDAMIIESQIYKNTPELSNFVFTPFGVRHDNPLYSVGNISSEKKEAFKLFSNFASQEEYQELARDYGFGEFSDYISEIPNSDGKTLFAAQELWKKGKDNGQEIVSVFVIDTSGSVEGEPLEEMKNSLINAGQYINSENYIGLVSYNSNVTINLPINKFDVNYRAYFNGEISSLSAGGGTATFDAIAVALQMIEQSKIDHPNAKFMLFVLSDGESNQGSLNDIRGFIENLNVPIYTIGYNANIAALKEISSINEAASINADTDDIIYQLKSLFNSQL